MVASLRVLKACRKTAVAARRVALQMIHNTIVCTPEDRRDVLRKMTRMQLVRTLAAWRPDLTDCRNPLSAYRIALKSLVRRYLELHDEIAELDDMIVAIVDELAPDLVARNSIRHGPAEQLLLTACDNSDRLSSEASFAALCGVSPIRACSRSASMPRARNASTAAIASSTAFRTQTQAAPRVAASSSVSNACPFSSSRTIRTGPFGEGTGVALRAHGPPGIDSDG